MPPQTWQHEEEAVVCHCTSICWKSLTALNSIMSMFSVLCRARNASVLHFLEPLFIINVEPEICKQLEFVKSLTVFAHLCGKSKPASANPK